MFKTLLFLWQLPQNILGFIIYHFYKGNITTRMIDGIKIYESSKLNKAFSLGNYILIGSNYFLSEHIIIGELVAHEYGHQKQSKMLGWLYLIIVGIPSSLLHIYAAYTKKDDAWYYGQYPESWADKLGKVERIL